MFELHIMENMEKGVNNEGEQQDLMWVVHYVKTKTRVRWQYTF